MITVIVPILLVCALQSLARESEVNDLKSNVVTKSLVLREAEESIPVK